MSTSTLQIVNLTGVGLSRDKSRQAAAWMAKAFALAPATPALTIFFGAAPYEANVEMHEKFWSSHLNRVAMSGILIGARENGEWCGFRAFFEPGKSRMPYETTYRLDDNEDWDSFLKLTGEDKYVSRIKEWGNVTLHTNDEIGIIPSECYTTSIIVVEPNHQRKGIGHALDEYTRKIIREAGRSLHVRIHEYILPFYMAQGYQLLATPTYSLLGSAPFKVHFLMHDGLDTTNRSA
ncbi:hypothetical protein DM02DRAFT_653250 [Periconia macrospinosa]|uniref:Uncharacterized protein n=1 Tax=Periconia macrospinosa TaxID=97972 RepID=A0A2V1DXY9_9PLEO|nr:hypothetical protein DM02DRAFT_653250 [Periconia macrospinosa]